jgi:hypothetical protein
MVFDKRQSALLATCVFELFAFCGCAEKYVVVKDDNGLPVQNAEIYAISLSINCGPHLTNKKGLANVPNCIQQAQWVSIVKNGYASVLLEIPEENRIEVILEKLFEWKPE